MDYVTSSLITMDSETVNVSSADQIGNSKTPHRQFNMQQTSTVESCSISLTGSHTTCFKLKLACVLQVHAISQQSTSF